MMIQQLSCDPNLGNETCHASRGCGDETTYLNAFLDAARSQ